MRATASRGAAQSPIRCITLPGRLSGNGSKARFVVAITRPEAGITATELLGLDVTDEDDDSDQGEKIHRRAARMAVQNAPVLADLTHDGAVDWEDLGSMVAVWLEAGSRRAADLNRDGLIDAADLSHLAPQWRHRAGQNGVQPTP